MNTHRVKVFDRTDDDAVIVFVTNHFHLIFFPTDQRFINQQLVRRRQVQTTGTDFFELFFVVRDTTTGTTHGERWTDDAREAQCFLNFTCFFDAVRNTGTWTLKANRLHGLIETVTVFRFIDGVCVRTDHFYAELFQYACRFQTQSAVQCSLTAHRWQQYVRAFFFDDLSDGFDSNRLDIGRVGHRRVSHDGRRVRVHQNNPVTFFTQCFTSLCT